MPKIRQAEGRRQRQLDNHLTSIIRLRPIEENSSFAKLIIAAAHSSSPHNSAKAELSVYGLQVFISKLSKKLHLHVRNCPACALYRAQEGRIDDLVHSRRLGAADYILRYNLWLTCQKVVLCGLAGPLRCDNSTIFALLLLELPLKTLQIIPLRDYSCSALYLALLTYAQKNLERCQMIVSDNGSQLSPFHTGVLGYRSTSQQDEDNPLTSWFKLSLSRYGENLQKKWDLFKGALQETQIPQLDRNVCENFKINFSRIQFNLQSELDIHQWMYLFALASKSVATRPIARSSSGAFFTPQKVLQLLSQAGSMELDPEFCPPIARSDDLQVRLEKAGSHLLQMRKELSFYLRGGKVGTH